MRKHLISICLTLLFCLSYSISYGSYYKSIEIGMDKTNVQSLLKDYTIAIEKEDHTMYKDGKNRLTVHYENNKVISYQWGVDGKEQSSIDMPITPDWSSTYIDYLNTLTSSDSYFHCSVNNRPSRYRPAYNISFYGLANSIPVYYSLDFNSEGGLSKVTISLPDEIRDVIDFLLYVWGSSTTGKEISYSIHLDSDYTKGESESYLNDYTHDNISWDYNGNKYELEFSTYLSNTIEDEYSSLNNCEHENTLIITPNNL